MRSPHPLFDPDYYLSNNPDVAQAEADPLLHFMTYGVYEGRKPNPFFDPRYYLERYPDVAAARDNPLVHYLTHGAAEGRDPSPLFDSDWYLAQNPDVAASGMNPLVHYLAYGVAEGRLPRPRPPEPHSPTAGLVHTNRPDKLSGVFGYFSTEQKVAPPKLRVALGHSSRGNFFMTEIAVLLERELNQIGMDTILFDEKTVEMAVDYDFVIVIAPHEFFVLDGDEAWKLLSSRKNLILLNTEQIQTQWFAEAQKYFSKSRYILDLNYNTASSLRSMGYDAYFLPLGFSEAFEKRHQGVALDRRGPLASLPQSILQCEPDSYEARPIDILFIGTISTRRSLYFAQNASFFSSYNTFLYLPDGASPFRVEETRTLDFTRFAGLARRSKVLLNIHRDEESYLEWQRIVSLGVLQSTLVVSETCDYGAVVVPNMHYIDGPLNALTELCRYYLDNIDLAENFASRSYENFRARFPMKDILKSLVRELVGRGI